MIFTKRSTELAAQLMREMLDNEKELLGPRGIERACALFEKYLDMYANERLLTLRDENKRLRDALTNAGICVDCRNGKRASRKSNA